MILGLTRKLSGNIVDHAIGERRHKLAVGHIVGKIRPAEKVPAATGAAHVGDAPHHALDAIGATRNINTQAALEPRLGHRIVRVVRIGILQSRKLSRVGVISALEGLLRNTAQLGELAVLVHGIARAGNFAAAINRILEHAVFFGVVVVGLLHKRNERPTPVELVIAQRVITVAIREALVVVAMALVLGKVLHLGSHVDKRNALDRPQHAREGLLGVETLIDIGGIRSNARRGLLGSGGCRRGNGAKRKRQRQARDNSRMLGLHKILPALV